MVEISHPVLSWLCQLAVAVLKGTKNKFTFSDTGNFQNYDFEEEWYICLK